MHHAPHQPLLSLRNVSKRYASTLALDDISVDFTPGSVHALIGENGAGKSTLVKTIAGIVRPDSGELILEGKSVAFNGPAAALAAGVTLVHQELALLPFSTVTENIFLGQERAGRVGLSRRKMQDETKEVLASLGVELDPTALVGTLSTAQQQMIEIARAIRRRSRLLILDEPTAALPPADVARLFDVIRALTSRGKAIIYISHRLDEIVELADEVTVMKDGRRVATRPADGLEPSEMISLMVGRQIEDLFPPHPPRQAADVVLSVERLISPPALKGVSFQVHAGEIVGIYGLEGHGQDEILTCLSGATMPISGGLTLHGESVAWTSVCRMISRGIGLVPEDRKSEGLALPMSGSQNITLPILPRIMGRPFKAIKRERDEAQSAARRAGVKGNLDAQVSTLSGGNQQKVLLARWLAANASMLLLNQPTRGVDVGSKAEIYSLIRKECAEHQAAAIVVSREISELRGLCDRILVMCWGRLAGEHEPTATEAEILATAVGHKQMQSA